MSGECEFCGEHCLECACENNVIKSCFDKKLLGSAPVSNVKFMKYKAASKDVKCEYHDEYFGKMCFLDPKAEKGIGEMTEVQLHLMADVIAENMLETYRDLILSQLLEIKKKVKNEIVETN